jgi:hypothetical protein
MAFWKLKDGILQIATALKYNKLTASRHKVCIFAALYGVFIAEQIIITHISK